MPVNRSQVASLYYWRTLLPPTRVQIFGDDLGVDMAIVVYKGTKKQRWREPIYPWRQRVTTWTGICMPCVDSLRAKTANLEGPPPIFDEKLYRWVEQTIVP